MIRWFAGNLLKINVSGILFVATVMMFDRRPPVEYVDLEPESHVVKREQIVRTKVTAHWRRGCHGTITRVWVISRTRAEWPGGVIPVQAPLEPRSDPYWTEMYIPPYLPEGEDLEYYSIGRWICNPLQRLWPIKTVTPRVKYRIAT